MNSIDFFSILTVVILGLFTAVFFGLYLYDRKQKFPIWVAAAYASALVAFLIDLNRTEFTSVTADYLANSFMWPTGIFLLMGFSARLKRPKPWRLIGGILFAAYAVQTWYSFVQPDIIMRSVWANVFAGLILAVALPVLWNGGRNVIDKALFWVMAALTLSYFVRPFVVYFMMGATHTHENYANSIEALAQHMTIALASLSGAVAMMIAAGFDIIRRAERAIIIDPLTGVMNRRGYEALLEEKMAGTAAQLEGRSVMMFDIDCFKQVNDKHGHHAGDEVLRRMAETAHSLVEHHGHIARVGGEEFAILVHKVSAHLAPEIAEHLRLAFALLVHPELPDGTTVTASFGLARTQKDETLIRALRRADMALYIAKDRGRNCIVDSAEVAIKPTLEIVA